MLHGTPFLAIIHQVLRDEYDLVMIAARVAGSSARGY
jgi:hypothetical protein